MVEAGRDPWSSSSSVHCLSRASTSRAGTSSLLPRAVYRHLYSFSRNRCSIVPLGNLCQCSATLTVEKVLPGFQMEPSMFQLMPIASSPVTGYHCKEPVKNPLLQAKHSYLSQPFQLREMSQKWGKSWRNTSSRHMVQDSGSFHSEEVEFPWRSSSRKQKPGVSLASTSSPQQPWQAKNPVWSLLECFLSLVPWGWGLAQGSPAPASPIFFSGLQLSSSAQGR